MTNWTGGMKPSIAVTNGVAARITGTATDSDTNVLTWPGLRHMAGLRSGQGRVDFADTTAIGIADATIS